MFIGNASAKKILSNYTLYYFYKNDSFEVEQASKIIECALIQDSFEADRIFFMFFTDMR